MKTNILMLVAISAFLLLCNGCNLSKGDIDYKCKLVMPIVEIINEKNGNNSGPQFLDVLIRTEELLKKNQGDQFEIFLHAFNEIVPNGNLAPYFATAANRDFVTFNSSNYEIISWLRNEHATAINNSVNIIHVRLIQYGIFKKNINIDVNGNIIQIEIYGIDDPTRIRNLISTRGKLEFWEVINFEDQIITDHLLEINRVLFEEQPKISNDSTYNLATLLGTDESTEVKALENNILDSTEMSEFYKMLTLPYGIVSLNDTPYINKVLRRIHGGDLKGHFPSNFKFLWNVFPIIPYGSEEEFLPLYIVKIDNWGNSLLSGEVIKEARVSYDERDAPAVSLVMGSEGTRKWRVITSKLAEESQRSGKLKRIAISLDDLVFTAPGVSVEIPNGQSIIQGDMTLEETQNLASILNSGAMPAKLVILEEKVIEKASRNNE